MNPVGWVYPRWGKHHQIGHCSECMGRPVVKVSSAVDTQDALVISCFPSVGMVSSVAAHYLIEHLNLEFVGGIKDSRLPPLCLVQDGAPLPPIRIYAGEPQCDLMGKCDKVVLLMSELIVPDALVHDIVETIFEWSKSAGIGAGILLDAFAMKGMKGGLNGNEPMVEYEDSEDVDVLGIGATQHMREVLEGIGVSPVEQGVIKGMTGVILGEGRRRGLDIVSLLVEADPRFPDARAAATLISHLNKLLPAIELDQAPLLEEAERLEEQIRGMIEHAGVEPADGQPSDMLYG